MLFRRKSLAIFRPSGRPHHRLAVSGRSAVSTLVELHLDLWRSSCRCHHRPVRWQANMLEVSAYLDGIGYFPISTRKTCMRSAAHVSRVGLGEVGESPEGTSTISSPGWAPGFDGSVLTGKGTMSGRRRERGARHPWYLVPLNLLGGIRAASRANNSSHHPKEISAARAIRPRRATSAGCSQEHWIL
jgi:hypothetical protein